MEIGAFFSKVFSWIFGKLFSSIVKTTRHVVVTSHAGILESSGLPCQFVKITNLSISRKAVLTEVWFQLNANKVFVVNLERPMPKELQPEEQWETWIALAEIQIGFHNAAAKLARVKLSDGTVHESKPTENVSERGFVAGR